MQSRCFSFIFFFAFFFFLSFVQAFALNDLSSFFAQGLQTQRDDASFIFSPEKPHIHGTWKGRKTLPCAALYQLCFAIAEYLSLPAENTAHFLVEIAAAESDFGYYVRQVRGPAQSVWQIEPATAKDMHQRLPRRNATMYAKIIALRDPNLSEEENVVTNLNYGAALCCGILYLKGIQFEKLHCLQVRAYTWKKYYNTYLGKGTFEGYCQKAMRYAGATLAPNFVPEEPFDLAMLQGGDIFAQRNAERFLTLPDDFDESPMGRYYDAILRKYPNVFEEIPTVLFESKNIQQIQQALLWQLIRAVQKDPASIVRYQDMPDQIFQPLVLAAMHENADLCYPNLPQRFREDPSIRAIYEAQKVLREKNLFPK